MIEKLKIILIIAGIFFINKISAQELPLTLENLCNQSSEIIIATAKATNSYQTSNGKYVFTDIRLIIEKGIKGTLRKNDEIVLTIYGGTIDGNTTYVVGFPKFKTDLKSLLFLKEHQLSKIMTGGPRRKFSVVGLSQGKIDIIQVNGEEKIYRDFEAPLKAQNQIIMQQREETKSIDVIISNIYEISKGK